jgi:hypothetical protein
MAWNSVSGISLLGTDDGVTFQFNITGNPNFRGSLSPPLGFFHRPIDAAAFKIEDGTVEPPVKWTEYHNLNGWVETLKNGSRHKTQVLVNFDDKIQQYYYGWMGPGSSTVWQYVYGVVDISPQQ